MLTSSTTATTPSRNIRFDASGTLSPLSVATVATGNSPQSIILDPAHQYAYVTNLSDNTISQYVIQSDGSLAPSTPATVATGHGPWAVALSPSLAWAYMANSVDNTISQFSVNASGVLVATAIAPAPTGKFAYEANYTVDFSAAPGTVSQYSVGTAGQLTPLVPAAVPAGTGPGWVTFDPFGEYACREHRQRHAPRHRIGISIGTDGALTLIGTAAAGPKAFMIATAY